MGKKSKSKPSSSNSSSQPPSAYLNKTPEDRLGELEKEDARAAAQLEVMTSSEQFIRDAAIEFDALESTRELFIERSALTRKLTIERDHLLSEKGRGREKLVVFEAYNEKLKAEKDSVLAVLAKTDSMKEKLLDSNQKLQELCRELQKSNKAIASNAEKQVHEELTKRKELSEKFSGTIDGVSAKIEEQEEARQTQLLENESLRKKMLDLLGKFDEQQKNFESALKTKDLENQLLEAKRAQREALAEQERAKAAAMEHTILALKTTEIELRKQLNLYGSKFDEFQKSLESSNGAYKRRMEDMSKIISRLEREKSILKQRAEISEKRLSKCQGHEKEITTLLSQKVKLERLCRALQSQKIKSQPPGAVQQENSGCEGGIKSTRQSPEASCSKAEPLSQQAGESIGLVD